MYKENLGGVKMIKIIEHGTIERKRCENCGCLFSYEKVDIQHDTSCNFGNNYDYDYIRCPQCKEIIRLGGKK